jgi:hypothetical protein
MPKSYSPDCYRYRRYYWPFALEQLLNIISPHPALLTASASLPLPDLSATAPVFLSFNDQSWPPHGKGREQR